MGGEVAQIAQIQQAAIRSEYIYIYKSTDTPFQTCCTAYFDKKRGCYELTCFVLRPSSRKRVDGKAGLITIKTGAG